MSAGSFSRYQGGGSPSQTPDTPKYHQEALLPSRAVSLQDHARRIVFEYASGKLEQPQQTEMRFEPDDVYLVWFTYVLGNWKALLSTTLPDGMYYEVTHNASRQATFLDVYKKFDNVAYPDTSRDFV
jgi:hypothetical protein